jgi:hypothetical protein
MFLVPYGVGYVAMHGSKIFAFLELDGLNTTDGGKSFCHQALIENKETVWKCTAIHLHSAELHLLVDRLSGSCQ